MVVYIFKREVLSISRLNNFDQRPQEEQGCGQSKVLPNPSRTAVYPIFLKIYLNLFIIFFKVGDLITGGNWKKKSSNKLDPWFDLRIFAKLLQKNCKRIRTSLYLHILKTQVFFLFYNLKVLIASFLISKF